MKVTTTAQGAVEFTGIRYLAKFEGTTFDPPVLIEAAEVKYVDEFDITVAEFTAWHNRGWMFNLSIEPEDEVEILIDNDQPSNFLFPVPIDRTNQVRVHGGWKQRGEVSWAPNGHPTQM